MINKRMRQYKSLCKETANALLGDSVNQPLTALFEECQSCKEINLWTYWHGIESLDAQNDFAHPKILLVGQDWGRCTPRDSKTIEELIREVENNPAKYNETFCALNNGTVTDKNLKRLFCKIDYDLDKKQPDLFFTNLIPYYRKGDEKISGFKRRWLTPAITKSFRELVEILEPQVVLCLGKIHTVECWML